MGRKYTDWGRNSENRIHKNCKLEYLRIYTI